MIDPKIIQEVLDGRLHDMGPSVLLYYREHLGLTRRAVATGAKVNPVVVLLVEWGLQPRNQVWKEISDALERLARIIQKRQAEKEKKRETRIGV